MAQYSLADGIAGLFNSPRFSDLIIRCDDRMWYAHKSVVCTQSEFFKKACEGEFKEATSGGVDLDDDDPLVVDALLMYLYTGDYSDGVNERDDRTTSVFNVQVFALAEKFFVKPLLHIAAYKFNAVAQKYDDAEDFADAIEEWARGTLDVDKILGNRILNIIVAHRSDIFKSTRALLRTRELIGQIPWLAAQTAQILSQLLDLKKSRALYHCPSSECKQVFMTSMIPSKHFGYVCPKCNKNFRMKYTTWDLHRVEITTLGTAAEEEEKAEDAEE